MSLLSLRLILAGSAAIATAAVAEQPRPRPSVEGYLCTFAGKCDPQAEIEQVTRRAPATKGFRLARPADDKADAAVLMPRASAVTPMRGARRDYREGTSRRSTARTASPMRSKSAMPAYSEAQARQYGGGAVGTARRGDLMIGFELNSTRISAEGATSAAVFAQSLMQPELSGKRFLIEGHTDQRGARTLNMALSERRAQAVVDYLVRSGVDRSRLVTRGVGPDVPLAGHRSSDPKNRRVEAALLP